MNRKTMSLRLRLLLLILLPLLIASGLLGIWRFQIAQTTAEELFDRSLLAVALAIYRDVAISEGDAISPQTRALISDAGGGEVFYHVTGPGGIYVTGYAYSPTPSVRVANIPQYSLASYRGESVRVLRMSETTSLDATTGEVFVTVWQRVSDRNALARAIAWQATALMAALMTTLAFVLWFGVQFGLRPLKDLQDAIHRRSADDLSPIQRPVPEEISGIVQTLNRLLEQVDHSIQAHQSFISDAAHQLRNPAAALLSLAESLPDVKTKTERKERAKALIDAARKSARLVEQLLSLERLRYDGVKAKHPADLAELARSVFVEFGAKVLALNLEMEYEAADEPLPIMCDVVLVSEAISNLADNALRHGGPRLTRIGVRSWRENDRAFLAVEDDGRGIRPEEVAKAFQRFGQLEAGDGSGLGLSIADEVVRSHCGQIWIDPNTQGTRIVFWLPIEE